MTTDEPQQDPLQQRVPLAPPVFAPPLTPAEPAVPLPAQTAPPTSPPPASAPGKRNSALVVLAIACSVLLLSTIGFGVTTAWLIWGGTSTALQPQPDPTPTETGGDGGATATVQGYPVTIASDLRVDHLALASDTGISTLYALVTNTSSNQVAQASFDITAYDADGRIIYRTLDLFYLLPDQTSVMDASFLTAIDDLDHLTIEQLDIEWTTPTVSGGATVVEARTGDGYVEADLSSTMTVAAEYTEIYLAVFVDDEIVGMCSDLTDLPANGGTLTASCGLDPAYDENEVDVEDLPADAEVDVFLKIDYTFGD